MIAKVVVVQNLADRIKNLAAELEKHDLKREHPDVLYIDSEQKVGIEQSRNIKDFFTLRPFQAKGRAVVVEDISGITPEAQNALLKLLEEPPESAVILFGTPFIHHLLPTVLSRVQVVHDDGDRDSGRARMTEADPRLHPKGTSHFVVARKDDELMEKILVSSVEERFKIVEKTTDKKELLQKLLRYSEKRLARDPDFHKVAKDVLQSEEWAQANVNMRGILEYLMLILPKK